MAMNIKEFETKPFPDSKAGTSGLRKKVPVFAQEHYVENWLEALFETRAPLMESKMFVTGGDGRYYSDVVIQKVMKMAIAHGFKHIIVGQNGYLSTPAVSALIRSRKADGGVILTASHNPGGQNADFGIKYNISSGAPAPEGVMNKQYEVSQQLKHYKIVDCPDFDISIVKTYNPFPDVTIEVVDPCDNYVDLMKSIFDFDLIKSLFQNKDFTFRFDALHGVTGPYALRIFGKELGADPKGLVECNPLPDFGGHHPDPNQVYAKPLCDYMFGRSLPAGEHPPTFGAACDGDGDRNMILGANCFVNPADSLAIICKYATTCIPFFQKNGLKGVARSSPTAACVDNVAKKLNLRCYETPTGWKFFGNLMDAEKISICGEESFGTGSIHIREKDGIWAVLCWLSIIAYETKKAGKVVNVSEIVENYYKEYGRYYIQRYDFEGVDSKKAHEVYDSLAVAAAGKESKVLQELCGDEHADNCDVFNYVDPVDNSTSPNNGIRFKFNDGSRFVLRLSGTSSAGATLRVYFEKYVTDPSKFHLKEEDVLKDLIQSFMKASRMKEILGTDKPTVIT